MLALHVLVVIAFIAIIALGDIVIEKRQMRKCHIEQKQCIGYVRVILEDIFITDLT